MERHTKRAFYKGQQSHFRISYGGLSADYTISTLSYALRGFIGRFVLFFLACGLVTRASKTKCRENFPG